MEIEKKKYFAIVDLVRGVAALMVVLCHFGGISFFNSKLITKLFYFGTYGVHMFFIVSGFVIPYSLYKSYKIKTFFRYIFKRSIRIDIPYFVILIIIGLKVYYLQPHLFSYGKLMAHFLYLPPFLDYEYYDPVFWSLTVEFQFYMVMALIAPLLSSDKKIIKWSVFVLFLSSVFITNVNLFFISKYTDLFSLGILIFFFKTKQISKLWYLLVSLFIIIIIGYTKGFNIAAASTIAFYVISFLKADNKMIRFGGKISYSLYLTHNIIRTFFFSNFMIKLFEIEEMSDFNKFFYLLVMIASALVTSIFFEKLVENPSKILSRKILPKN